MGQVCPSRHLGRTRWPRGHETTCPLSQLLKDEGLEEPEGLSAQAEILRKTYGDLLTGETVMLDEDMFLSTERLRNGCEDMQAALRALLPLGKEKNADNNNHLSYSRI